ncbi:flagellar motor protein [Quatrionicoccus australiensis]|uniref:flagellar motor protein n=1 Tax=Quatrionicoccus australiensis TaxID=138118 RepID=UPI001CF8F756|nr:flagellar motor protein [Quatrionicoccus australiensis]UCV15946.1 flagellar motor protein [Quatrionicoccus australiensis]
MDKISLAGLAIGLIAILGGQLLEGGNIGSLVQPTALLIVCGGTLGAVLLQSPLHVFKRGMKMAKWVWVPPVIEQKRLVDQILNWSQLSRREGLLALENFIPGIKDEFIKKGLQLLVDGADPERIRELLEVEINTFEDEWRQSAKIWESAGGYSPTIGILGAVMGLIHVMENLSDPTKLGSGIAVAFVATIYGVGLANLVYLPIAGKLKYYISRMVSSREMLIDGLVGIAVGDNPRIIEGRLRGYLL